MTMTRRSMLKMMAVAAAGSATAGHTPWALAGTPGPQHFTSHRPPPGQRTFTSPAVEHELARVKARIGNPKLAALFENCYPNTLDTTVHAGTRNGKPDTFIVTGDIDAMWLRDSAAQVEPYLPLAANDAALTRLFRGLIHRQASCIHIDPYANAFMPDPTAKTNLSWAQHDQTDMKPGVAERKWEIDSLCWTIRLAHGYWKATGDRQPFDDDWRSAMRNVVDTFRMQQRKHGHGPYHFQRVTANPYDTVALGGYGNPGRPVGLIFSMFRPSDDACVYPLFVPANAFAVVSLRQLADMARELFHDGRFAMECDALANEVEKALHKYAVMPDADGKDIWAYEVDGYGNQLFMDDANIPSLSSLSWLGFCKRDDALYQRTRASAWSSRNPYFFTGTAAEGIGGPHEGLGMIWPMSIIMRAMTSSDSDEIRQCLHWLRTTDAGTGFMHEAFDKDHPEHFTRSWFAWANSLFGEMILTLDKHHPSLLKRA